MARVYTTTRIFDTRVDAMFKPGGIVWRYWDEWTDEVRKEAYFQAPVGDLWHGHLQPTRGTLPPGVAPYGPGNLAKNIGKRRERRVARRQLVWAITANTHYASYVIRGTNTIFSESGMWAPLPPQSLRYGLGWLTNPGNIGDFRGAQTKRGSPRQIGRQAGRRIRMYEVSGQEPNDFLSRAIDIQKAESKRAAFESRFRRLNRVTTKRRYPFGF